MKFLFDLFPVALFFVAINVWDIFIATAVVIAATCAQVGWLLVRKKRIEPMLWVSLGIVVVFGGLTIYLHDKTFILWKPTVLYWLFCAALVGASFLGKNPIKAILGEHLQMPEAIWTRLNFAWAGFFAVLGAANLYVAYNFSEKIWAAFKAFGTTGLIVVFVIAQSVFLARHAVEPPQAGERRP